MELDRGGVLHARPAPQYEEHDEGGPFLHDDPRDRPPAIFNGTTSLHFGRGKTPYLLLPIIPPKKRAVGRK